ncbi:hypothetical protein C0989_000212 [Termitomyces sp. Mn162]|nr:hypothetical protein C0989_000212 [Termitomyces sp. Mn162]
MSVYNPVYNSAGYLTNIYGRPVPENPYTLFYSDLPTDQYIPCYWTPDPNQAFYTPSISQEVPLGWHHSPAFPTNGNNPHMYPGGYYTALPNSTYLSPAHYYTYPVPATAPAPLEHPDNYSPPHLPFSAQVPPSPRQQRVEAYVQQHNKVLCSLCLSLMKFARCACTLCINLGLGYPDTPATLEVWADQLLNFHKHYLQENLPKTIQIYTSPNPHPFEDPLDPSCSFYMQCKELIEIQSEALPPIPHQQEELNAASSILRNLNPAGGLFDQLATHTLALSTCPQANSVPSAFYKWDQPTAPEPHTQWLLLHVDDDNQTLSYIDKPGNPANEPAPHSSPPQDRPPYFNLHAPYINIPPPCQNLPAPSKWPTGPGALQLPFPTNLPCLHPLQCPIPLLTSITLDPPPLEDPLPLNGPQGLP